MVTRNLRAAETQEACRYEQAVGATRIAGEGGVISSWASVCQETRSKNFRNAEDVHRLEIRDWCVLYRYGSRKSFDGIRCIPHSSDQV